MSARRLRVGDHVHYYILNNRWNAVVIEDRGDLGVSGRQIVRIELTDADYAGDPPSRFEFPAEELALDQAA